MSDIIATPDSMLDDQDSMAFYVLRDESLALCKHESHLQYHKKRETYLACGRFSHKHKRVVFWPGAVNPSRAVQLLVENMHVDSGFTWHVSGATTKITKRPAVDSKFARYDSVRKADLKNLVDRGMNVQCKKEDSK